MRVRQWFATAGCLLAGLGAAGAASAAEPTVIVLSWDGLRHDFPDRTELPALGRMQEQGLRAERLIPVFPSNTFPNHVALATGAHADRHGIVDNVFRDRERGLYSYSADASWLEAEPIWAAAERQGVRAAVFFWVGSETAWRGTAASYRMTPFDGEIGEAEKVAQILAWLDLPAAERPRLVMAWWHGADSVGHMKGPEHPDLADQLREQDGHLLDLIRGIDARGGWDDTTLLLVSDHGMTEVSEVIEVRAPLEDADIAADVLPGSSTARVYLEDPASLAEAERVLRAIADVEVYTAETLPAGLRVRHATRSSDLMLVTTPPRTFYQVDWMRGLAIWFGGTFLGWHSGMHGYHPDHPDMGAAFLALGRGAAPGERIGPVRAIDVAPTIAALLGIEPPRQAEGSGIAPLDPRRATAGSARPAESAAAAGP